MDKDFSLFVLISVSWNQEYEEYKNKRGVFLIYDKNYKINGKRILRIIDTGKTRVITSYKFNKLDLSIVTTNKKNANY